MVTEADLREAIETAFLHCRPGGVAVFVPDRTRESFDEATDHGGTDDHDGGGVRYLEWTWDPDPEDTEVRTEYAFVFREANRGVWVVHETHHFGLFDRESWLALLTKAGFEGRAVTEVTSEDREPRQFFVGHRPAGPAG